MNKIKNKFYKLKHALQSTILCLRFPFLKFSTDVGSYKLWNFAAKLENEGQKQVYQKCIETNEYWHATIIYNKRKLWLSKVLFWINKNIIDKIWIFRTSCWYYCIPQGWRKAFGIQMCKELKESLLRSGGRKALKAYGIDDIKEKFGNLAWYDHGGTIETSKIVSKYEFISMHTCIVCGIPATVQTMGWISPYCDEHVPDFETRFDFGHKGLDWYGWTGNINRRKNWEQLEKDWETYKKRS